MRDPGAQSGIDGPDGTVRRAGADPTTLLEAARGGFLSPPATARADFIRMTRTILGLSLLTPCLILASCASTPDVDRARTPVALGMVASAQDSDSSFAGKPGDMQDTSFKGKPGEGDPNAATPQGTGYNQQPGELRPQIGGGDVHYHNHFHGDAGYAAPVYGAPVRNGHLGAYNNGHIQAPLGTGGGGAGWYGPNYQTGPTGLRQGYGPYRGLGTANNWGGYAGGYNGWTD